MRFFMGKRRGAYGSWRYLVTRRIWHWVSLARCGLVLLARWLGVTRLVRVSMCAACIGRGWLKKGESGGARADGGAGAMRGVAYS